AAFDGERRRDAAFVDESVAELCHYATPSISSTVCSRTLAPLAQSSQWVSSFGEWLTPPTLGTKIMPIGPSCALICASWAAALGNRDEPRTSACLRGAT